MSCVKSPKIGGSYYLERYIQTLQDLGYDYTLRFRRHLFQPNVSEGEQLVYIPNNEFWLLTSKDLPVPAHTQLHFCSDLDSLHCSAGEFRSMSEGLELMFTGELSLVFDSPPPSCYLMFLVLTPVKRNAAANGYREAFAKISATKCSCNEN